MAIVHMTVNGKKQPLTRLDALMAQVTTMVTTVKIRRLLKRLLLKPFIVEAALARLERPLTLDEQKVVLRDVNDPEQVNWPDWWEAS